MKKLKVIITEYWREPTPSCNWCPRYAVAYDAKTGERLKEAWNGDAPNLRYEYQKEFGGWEFILHTEVEVTKSQFKRFNRE